MAVGVTIVGGPWDVPQAPTNVDYTTPSVNVVAGRYYILVGTTQGAWSTLNGASTTSPCVLDRDWSRFSSQLTMAVAGWKCDTTGSGTFSVPKAAGLSATTTSNKVVMLEIEGLDLAGAVYRTAGTNTANISQTMTSSADRDWFLSIARNGSTTGLIHSPAAWNQVVRYSNVDFAISHATLGGAQNATVAAVLSGAANTPHHTLWVFNRLPNPTTAANDATPRTSMLGFG